MTTRSTKSATTAEEVAAIEDLVSDLERRLRKLSDASGSARREIAEESGEIKDFVSEALADITNRVRQTAANVGNSVTDEASRVGSETARKIIDEVEQRPLIMLAVAAGIGFLVGFANRR